VEQALYPMIRSVSLLAVLAPLCGALFAGLAGRYIGKTGAHFVTIIGVALSFIASLFLYKWVIIDNLDATQIAVYTWVNSGGFDFNIGFLIDHMTVIMMAMVTFISLLVHIYSIGYMADDPGYQRFFCYMSLFTFSMLMLVSANNFLQLFFGWEGVGVVSYLLIGFWFNKESAAAGSLKAFLVNRVGDFGFLLGMALIFGYVGSLNYATVFANASVLPATPICLLLFVGAMGKSAQMPLHVWLPESMEGPTPISALIHAATMVTAGIYMIARMSPLFELSDFALSTVMVVGATGALFLGLVGVVQFDIKRIIAYSTMSQLGYMVAATGSSAFSAGMFHLFTHAFFKALLFLGAGSVIVALHHEQDIRKMGNLKKYMPLTYITFLIGSLSLSAVPPFSGFYSKDAIIEAVKMSSLAGSSYAYGCLVLGAFVTSLYSFRAVFLVFHGQEHSVSNQVITSTTRHVGYEEQSLLAVNEHRNNQHNAAVESKDKGLIHEPKWPITLPLVILAVPSAIIGSIMVNTILHKVPGLLGDSVYVAAQHRLLEAGEFKGWFSAMYESVMGLPFWFAVSGILTAWLCYIRYPKLPYILSQKFSFLYHMLVHKYGFDEFYNWLFVRGGRALSGVLYQFADMKLIDTLLVNGSARSIAFFAKCLRHVQSGYLYHYAFIMIVGLVCLLAWGIWL